MTHPPVPLTPAEAAARRALVKNLLGLVLMVLGGLGVLVLAWFVDPRLFTAALLGICIGLGYLLATSEG